MIPKTFCEIIPTKFYDIFSNTFYGMIPMMHVERAINHLEKECFVQWTSLVDCLVTCKLKVDLTSRKLMVNTLNLR